MPSYNNQQVGFLTRDTNEPCSNQNYNDLKTDDKLSCDRQGKFVNIFIRVDQKSGIFYKSPRTTEKSDFVRLMPEIKPGISK